MRAMKDTCRQFARHARRETEYSRQIVNVRHARAAASTIMAPSSTHCLTLYHGTVKHCQSQRETPDFEHPLAPKLLKQSI